MYTAIINVLQPWDFNVSYWACFSKLVSQSCVVAKGDKFGTIKLGVQTATKTCEVCFLCSNKYTLVIGAIFRSAT